MAHQPSTPQRAPPPHFDMFQSSSPAAGPSSTQVVADEDDGSEDNIFRDMEFEDVLDELAGRFLVNLPEEENSSLRLYWQAEQAHWFYEDYLRPLNPLLPALSQRQFTHLIIASSPVHAVNEIDYDAVWQEYCAYKKMVPCCGGILINEAGDKVLMVRGWKSNAGWCFPRGKINADESEAACAVREVEEETGFDLSGLVNPADFIKTQINAQEITMFIVKDIDEATVFETQTRNEIGAIEWVPFLDLPTWTHKKGPKRTATKGQKRFYNVTPFVGPLKKWLTKHGINPHPPRRKAEPQQQQQQHHQGAHHQPGGFHREIQPYAFDAGPKTELDHLFAKFIQKEDDVERLESDRAISLDHLFGSLYVGGPSHPQPSADEQRENDALTRLLSGIGGPAQQPAQAQPAATQAVPPMPNAKQSKLLSALNPANPPSPPRSMHHNTLLSMLAPPGSAPAAAPAPTSTSVSSTVASAPDNDEERRNRQRGALLESLLPISTAPTTPPAPGQLRPMSAASVTNGMISPMPPMPPPQSWSIAGHMNASPSPAGHQAPLQQSQGQQQYPPALQQQQQQHPSAPPLNFSQPYPPTNPVFSPPQPMPTSPAQPFSQSPPGPATDHQRNLLGTLFSPPASGLDGSMQAPPPGIRPPFPQPQTSMGLGPYVPPGYPQPPPNFYGAAPSGPPGGMPYSSGPPGLAGPGRPMMMSPPQMFNGGQGYQARPAPYIAQQQQQAQQVQHQQYMVQQQRQQQAQQAQQQAHQALQQAHQAQSQAQAQAQAQLQTLPPTTAQKLVSPSAVHQPVPRPPVGQELLGLINGR